RTKAKGFVATLEEFKSPTARDTWQRSLKLSLSSLVSHDTFTLGTLDALMPSILGPFRHCPLISTVATIHLHKFLICHPSVRTRKERMFDTLLQESDPFGHLEPVTSWNRLSQASAELFQPPPTVRCRSSL
ncbi:hypothetical protein PanWU01x14_259710, partial [Parasponia andersonii]